jgi:hypothetical protein
MTPVEASDRRKAFCARLKSERERRGTSLATIAASTKIKASLLDALERADLSRWPKGLYRRAFFREYAAAIGLPVDETFSEFTELFADADAPRTPPVAAEPPKAPETLRLLLGPAPEPPFAGRAMHDLARRLAFAVGDVCLALILASIAAAVSPLTLSQSVLVVGLAGYLTTAALGESPSLWLSARVGRWRTTLQVPSAASAFAPGRLPFQDSSLVLTFSDRFIDALGSAIVSGRALLHDCVERLSASELMARSQRRRELASVRRQRAETANRGAADELVM